MENRKLDIYQLKKSESQDVFRGGDGGDRPS